LARDEKAIGSEIRWIKNELLHSAVGEASRAILMGIEMFRGSSCIMNLLECVPTSLSVFKR